MEFLTATEIASIWGITPRMITNYCENGRIKGAVKKGGFWLIPSTAEKPKDKRYSKGNVNIEKKHKFEKYDEQVKNYMSESYSSTLFAFANFGEYEEKIIKSIDLEGDDIYSNLIRTVTFDENGFIASKMFLIDKEQSDIDGVYLESGKCLHTVLYTDDHDELIMNKLLDACKKWAKENDAEFRGVLYIFIKFVVPNAKSSTFYYDVWLPLR